MSALLTSTTACNTLAFTILSGTTNLAARAGMMCSQLQLCPAAGCSSLTTTQIGSGAPLSGALDLCAAEGVAGGTPTPLPSATRGPANCRTATECSGTGMMCIFPPSPPQVCECSAGSDVCYGLGNCTSYCSLNSTLDTVAALNTGTRTCDVAQGGVGVCSATEVCTFVSGCQEWVCDAATQSLKQANQVLSLLSGADQKLRGQLDPTQPFTGSFNVSWCSACAAPRAAVIGPPTVTEVCEGVSSLLSAANAAPPQFDASLSTDPSGHAQWANVQWAVPAGAPGSAASKAVLQAAVDRTNALPTVSAPTITVLGASSQPFKIIDGLGAGAQAAAVCKGKSLEWKWNSTWPGLPSAGVAGQTLWLQGPVPAINGQSIPLVVTANYVGDSSTAASATVTMIAVGSNPVAVLSGPTGDVPDNEQIVLNATASSDPDTTRALQQLSFRWTCRREDFPAPCFTGASQGNQDSVPGVWTLPAGLLTAGKTHVFTVTVVKDAAAGSTASALTASQSLSLRPRSTAVPFPRGNLTRQCAAAGCGSPHPTDRALTVMLTIGTEFVASTVSWSSGDAAGVAGLTAASAANTPGMPPGVHTLTVPSSVLPTNRPSITITATMTSPANVSGEATLTVPLNGAPFCSLVPQALAGASAAANGLCLEVTALADTFPTAAFRIRANNWADSSASALNTLSYDFGIRSLGDGGAVNDAVQQSSAAPSGTLVGMQQGNVTLYGCAIDPEGSRTCGTVVITVKPPGAGFNASAALSTVDVNALLESNDKRSLLQAANTAAAIMSTVNTSDPAAAELVSKQSAALVSAILSGTSMTDATQRNQAVAAMSAIASSSGAALSDSSRAVFANAAKDATASLGTTAVDASFVAQSSLVDLLTVASRLAAALVRQAAPGGSYVAAGSQGVFVGAVALAAPSAVTLNASTSGLVAAGPDAAKGAAANSTIPTNGTSSGTSTSGAGRHRRLQQLPADVPLAGRQLLQSSTTPSGRSGSAEVFVVLAGAIATGAGGWGLSLSYATQATGAVASTLVGQLPATVSLLGGGLASVAWSAISTSATASPPALDGTTNYLLLRIPAPGFDPSKSTACLRYNATATPPTATGSLAGVPPGSSPAAYVSYDSVTGRVTCRASAVGSYVVAQGPAPPAPPPVAVGGPTSPPPPDNSNTSSVASAPPPPGSNPEAGVDNGAGGGSGGVNVALIAGVVGGVVGAALLAGAGFFAYRAQKRRKQLQLVTEEGPAPPDPGIGIGMLPAEATTVTHIPGASAVSVTGRGPGAASIVAINTSATASAMLPFHPSAAVVSVTRPAGHTMVVDDVLPFTAAPTADTSRPNSSKLAAAPPLPPRSSVGGVGGGGWTSGPMLRLEGVSAAAAAPDYGGPYSPVVSGRLSKQGATSASQVTPFLPVSVAQHRGVSGKDSGPPSSAGSHTNRSAWS
ncbi:hypothetical protein HXX76_003344 [Chlamydomonas incerta]|uniref:PKD/REJ-like domain-containing protein n=1 Tax=Chlamydomonas incerta TaxID=51695 RepID=A0A835TAB1_CHLIN|nr:hypothetical protein HXX76_003344 [Chlamydomonas incerta]|eukprot:KAG2441729.1 hypothetical protein HXX76_003344 [Chlamydomonas incerta]